MTQKNALGFPVTNAQIPDNAILDANNKQTYLGTAYTFIYPTGTLAAGVETPTLLLANPVTSPVALFVDRKRITSAGGASVFYAFYLNPTVTNAGTPVTPNNRRTAATTTPNGVLTTLPTVSSNGTLLTVLAVGPYSTSESDFLRILDPGQTVLITTLTSVVGAVGSEIGWYEL